MIYYTFKNVVSLKEIIVYLYIAYLISPSYLLLSYQSQVVVGNMLREKRLKRCYLAVCAME